MKVYCRQTKQPKTVRAEAGVGIPEVIAGQVDVLPADRREMGEQRIRNRLALPAKKIKRPAEIHCVPERDGGGDEGQPTGPILPCCDSAIAQAAKAVEADGTRKRVARFALFSSTVVWRRSSGISSQSRVNSVRSMRPISRKASASPFCLG